MGFETWEELVKKNPPLSRDQIKLFANPKTSVLDVFADRRLHFDFEQSWEKFAFNREASKLFVTDFLSKVKAGQYSNPPVDPRYLTANHVAIALSVYMDTCRRKYREVLDPVSADEKERRADSACKNGRRTTVSTAVHRIRTQAERLAQHSSYANACSRPSEGAGISLIRSGRR